MYNKHDHSARPIVLEQNRNRKSSIDATTGPLFPKIFRYAVPVLLTDLLNILYNAADSLVVGNYAGHTALAAVTSAGSLIATLLCVLTGLALGCGIVLAREYGAKNYNKMEQVLHTGYFVGIIGGLIIGAACFILTPTFLTLMSFPADIVPEATLYLRLYFLGVPFNTIYLFGAQSLLAIGDSRHPLLYLSLSGIVNVILNFLLDAGFGLGVAGVAIGTVASQALSCILMTRRVRKGVDVIRLDIKKIRFHLDSFKKIFAFGIPQALSDALFGFSNIIVQVNINSAFNSVEIAGFGAASHIEHIANAFIGSLSKTNLVFVSQNYGAGNLPRIRKVILEVCGLSLLIVGALSALLLIFSRPFAKLFCSETDPAVIDLFVEACYGKMLYICRFYLLLSINNILTSSIRAFGFPNIVTIVSFIAICGSRLAYLFFLFPNTAKTYSDLFVIYPISWAISLVSILIIFLFVYRKRKKDFEAASTAQ